MQSMDGWDVALLVLAGYVAVVALVRMTLAHREQTAARMRIELERQRRQQALEAKAASAAKKAA
ncbi:MAG: hypothetical protein KF708_10985 [Pirellulales bacterium]|nr:hypothetical protein [Pirellulales bacterium]